MKRGRNKLSIRDQSSVKAVYRPTTTTLIVSRTARNTILVLEQLVRWDFHDQILILQKTP